jgi:hypothetical protein
VAWFGLWVRGSEHPAPFLRLVTSEKTERSGPRTHMIDFSAPAPGYAERRGAASCSSGLSQGAVLK